DVDKTSAAGKIPGGFFKREGRLSDREVLVSRFIDRSIRPLFAEGYNDETQIIATVLSADAENRPDIPAFIGASAALAISEIPFLGPIAAVRMGRAGDRWIINPTAEESAASDVALVVCGSRGALVMVEGGAKQVPEPEILAGLKRAHQEIVAAIDTIEALRAKVGGAKLHVSPAADRSELASRVRAQAEARLSQAVQIRAKQERYDAIAEVEK